MVLFAYSDKRCSLHLQYNITYPFIVRLHLVMKPEESYCSVQIVPLKPAQLYCCCIFLSLAYYSSCMWERKEMTIGQKTIKVFTSRLVDYVSLFVDSLSLSVDTSACGFFISACVFFISSCGFFNNLIFGFLISTCGFFYLYIIL